MFFLCQPVSRLRQALFPVRLPGILSQCRRKLRIPAQRSKRYAPFHGYWINEESLGQLSPPPFKSVITYYCYDPVCSSDQVLWFSRPRHHSPERRQVPGTHKPWESHRSQVDPTHCKHALRGDLLPSRPHCRGDRVRPVWPLQETGPGRRHLGDSGRHADRQQRG